MGFLMSFLLNFFLIPFPESVAMNAVGNGISGLVSGFMGGYIAKPFGVGSILFHYPLDSSKFGDPAGSCSLISQYIGVAELHGRVHVGAVFAAHGPERLSDGEEEMEERKRPA